jgi:hypothetical protein
VASPIDRNVRIARGGSLSSRRAWSSSVAIFFAVLVGRTMKLGDGTLDVQRTWTHLRLVLHRRIRYEHPGAASSGDQSASVISPE